ncbi:MAG TPA: Piwi domain-containing protein [Bryobacteraceae bacterium]|nr:Piwi domain-containing protein [Bryobacteraceae bacterium]
MHLNYLPLRFTSDVFNGGVLSVGGNPKDLRTKDSPISLKLRELRRDHGATHFFYAAGENIFCIPLKADAPLIGEKKQFGTLPDFQLANALARNALFEFFKQTNQTVVRHRPVTVVLDDHNLASARQDVFGIFPEYELDVRPLAPHEGEITSGVLVGFGIRYVFLKTTAQLLQEGVSLSGLYLVRILDDDPDAASPYERRYLGRFEGVRDGMAILSDSDCAEFPLDKCYPEGSRGNIEALGRALLGDGYDAFSTALHEQTFGVMSAEQQVKRLNTLGEWLERKSPLACSVDLGIRILKTPHECPRGTDAGFSHHFTTPSCVLRPGGSITVPWPVDKQIDQHGPYDAESFPDKRVRISVICPEEFEAEVGQFLRQFKDGVHSSDENAPFRQGFVRKYHLNSCDFTFHNVKRAAASLEEGYKSAALDALKDKPNVAIVVIRDQHRELPDASNPYYTTKARMMAQGVPVQLVKIETIRQRQTAYILNNLGLAVYAKLGGIPWTLAPNQDLAHEIVVGIGSARLTDSRRGAGERVIGITTVFSGDGQYLLANNTKEVSSDQYLDALTASLKETVAELRSRFGWKPKDRVRFIFHQSFKKYKDVEAEAVKQFAASLSEFDVKYAFVHVSDSHNWMLLDPKSPGVKFGRSMKGKMVPARGQCVPLGPHTALVTLSGPYQVKTARQGCPHPVLVSIHEDSTFTSLDYLARQVFNLSFMSWRGFNPSTLPVSISYSNMIVDLLGHLRHVKNWNPETLATALKERRWFL